MLRLALLGLPLSLLILSAPAQAGKKDRKAAAGQDEGGEERQDEARKGATARALGSGEPRREGSIWDWIEAADAAEEPAAVEPDLELLPMDSEGIEASEELEQSRDAERSVISQAARYQSPLPFYVDPKGTLEHDPLHLSAIDLSEFDIPMVVNDAVIKWMEYFTGSGRKHYARYLSRSTKYQPMMKAKLRAAGLPEDLVYLSLIESGYNPHAYSSAAAAGLWQFIPSTGKMYDLRIDQWVDERRDPEKATDAAIRLLSDLHNQYDDWYLAWAAYNAGPGRINRALKTWGRIDFWTMVQKGSFRPETDNYVPKLLAAAIIGKHPERYGFTGIDYQEPDRIQAVEVGPGLGLDVLARTAGISNEEFQRINPHLRRWALPPSPAKQTVYIPAGTATTFLAKLEQLPPEERRTFAHHTVRKGESLSMIATRYGVSMAELQATNKIANANKIYPGMNLVIPSKGGSLPAALTSTTGAGVSRPEAAASSARATSSAASTAKAPAPRTQTISHIVRKGETLSTIASRYGVSMSDLQSWNGIRNANHVMVGQTLKVQTRASSSAASSGAASSSAKAASPSPRRATPTTYTVRSGDTLTAIAAKHGLSLDELRRLNGIKGSHIEVGQKLKVGG